MKALSNKEALVFLSQHFYDDLLTSNIDFQKLKLADSSLTKIRNEDNVIIFCHGSHNGILNIGEKIYHTTDIIQATRPTNSDPRCFDIFACYVGSGIQSSDESRQRLEKKYKDNLEKGEYVILNGGHKVIHSTLSEEEIARTIKEGDDKCPPYIRVLRRMCNYPETIKLLYVVKEINPTTGKSETKLVTYKFSALKLTPPEEVTIDKIRAHLSSSMEQFKNEFLLHTDEGEKEQIESEIEKEIERLKKEVLSKDDHLTMYGNKTLFIEAMRGRPERVKTYVGLDKLNVNFATENGETLLYIASHSGYLETVTYLLEAGADPNLAKNNEVTPLYMASQEGHIEVVELLLANNADPNLCNKYGATPLLIASERGHTKIVATLLNNKAKPNVSKKDGATPLHMASQNGHIGVVDLLLQAKSNSNSSCCDGTTSLLLASEKGYTKIVELLLNAEADPNICHSSDRIAPLHMASQEGHIEVVKLLLSKEAKPNLIDKNGVTSLLIASTKGHTKVVKILLEAEADPNLSSRDGISPIVMAIFKQNTEIVKMLLPKVDLSVCTWKGNGVKELIEERIQDKEEKRKLLETLSLPTPPSASPSIIKSEVVSDNVKISNTV